MSPMMSEAYATNGITTKSRRSQRKSISLSRSELIEHDDASEEDERTEQQEQREDAQRKADRKACKPSPHRCVRFA